MSRGFVRETDQEPAPFVPPRAVLPAGVTNHVTPAGLAALHTEATELEAEKASLDLENEDEQRRALVVLNARLAALNQRIASANVIDPTGQPREEVRFGATVTLLNHGTGKEQTFQIVGVDEADVKRGKIAFVSPLARAVAGHWVGESAELRLGGEPLRVARRVPCPDPRFLSRPPSSLTYGPRFQHRNDDGDTKRDRSRKRQSRRRQSRKHRSRQHRSRPHHRDGHAGQGRARREFRCQGR